MKKNILALLTLILLLAATFWPASAQTPAQLSLRLSKDFGFSSGTGQIQGTFSMRVTGPQDLARVEFYIDGKLIGQANAAPFNLQFSTGSFSLGVHSLTATGYTTNGDQLASNEIKADFVSAAQGTQTTMRIVIPILVVAFGAILLSVVIPAVVMRGKRVTLPAGAPRNYGAIGGTICPKCHRPFGMHFWAPNIGIGKFDRCPYCGKWSAVRRVSIDRLRAAEEAELKDARQGEMVTGLSEEEKLHKELDDSRYQDS